MKKLFCIVLSVFILTGCGKMNNTPTRKVEALLSKYQSNDSEVMNDLDNVLLMDSNFTDEERNDYKEFMKKHYQDMTYKVKDESIDGDSATVEVEVTVRNYSNVVNEANDYRLNNSSEFDDDNTFAKYRLGKLKAVSDTETYTIVFTLTKSNDEWQVNPLSTDDENKLNGLYGVSEINISDIPDVDTTNESNADETHSDEANSTSDNMSDESEKGNE